MENIKAKNASGLARDLKQFGKAIASGFRTGKLIEVDLNQLDRKFRRLYNLRMKS